MEMMRSVYPHDQVFGEFCTVNSYIDCPPDELFDYMADTRCLEEWTYSLRGFTPTEEPGLWLAYDRLGSETQIFTRTHANKAAMTVDYHCAWDQGKLCSTSRVRWCCGPTAITRSTTAICIRSRRRRSGLCG